MKGFSSNIAGLVEAASQQIKAASYCIAITGAGISTPSGIPDFRSASSGLWTKHAPMEVASLSAFRQHPERFYNWLRPFVRTLIEAEPNPAHHFLARLEAHRHIKQVVTQNIDALHQRAGSMDVVEVHGTYRTLTCPGCSRQINASKKMLESFINGGLLPHCPSCENLLKPDVILFEEQLPAQKWNQAKKAAKKCDLMLALGSSLTVTPVSTLPLIASQSGASLIIINHTPTPLDPLAEIVIPGDLAEVLPAIARKVLSHD